MSEIADLESRISAAMARIGRAIQGVDTSAGVNVEDLEHARTAAEAAEARARKGAERAETAEAEVARLQQALEAETMASGQLRERVAALKATKERQQERISGLETEMAAMNEAHAADRVELDGLISALEPLVKEQTDA